MNTILLVGMGGFLGANARYFISTYLTRWFMQVTGSAIPFGTMFVNVTGSALLAFFTVWVSRRLPMGQSLQLLISTGFFGAYTTFSTYAGESINLLSSEGWRTGLIYIILTNLFCLLGVIIGISIAERFFPT